MRDTQGLVESREAVWWRIQTMAEVVEPVGRKENWSENRVYTAQCTLGVLKGGLDDISDDESFT